MHKRHLTASVLLASALALTACGGSGSDDVASTGSSSSAGHGGGHSSSSAKGNDADVAFLTGMMPHHEQAVEMSEIVLAANPPAEVAAIARQIKDAQSPEIEQMEMMLGDLGKTSESEHGAGHSEGHGGMMSDADLAALRAATGTEAARLYLEAMIAHHEGAIEASEAQLADGSYAPAKELATSIAKAQAAEIATMRKLLASL